MTAPNRGFVRHLEWLLDNENASLWESSQRLQLVRHLREGRRLNSPKILAAVLLLRGDTRITEELQEFLRALFLIGAHKLD